MSKIVRAVHANRGVEVAYKKALRNLVDDMHKSVSYWVTAAYRKYPPRVATLVAQDAFTNSEKMQAEIEALLVRWVDRFFNLSDQLAELYVGKMFKSTDNAFKSALRDAGWSVNFKMTPAMRDAFEASIAENVGLIRSIPEQYLQQVQGVVMRSYTAGRDLETMVSDLKTLYPKASHRATLIARDQSNKANAVVNRTRQLELGITQARWMHSHAGKEPRPDHVAANGKVYSIAEGYPMPDGFIQPGEAINCRCTSRAILPI